MLSISRYIELKTGDMRELGEREQQGDSNGQDWVDQIVHTSHWVKCDPRHTIWTLPNLAQDTRIQLYQASALLNLPEIQSHLEGEICLEGKSRALVATDNEKEFFISFLTKCESLLPQYFHCEQLSQKQRFKTKWRIK